MQEAPQDKRRVGGIQRHRRRASRRARPARHRRHPARARPPVRAGPARRARCCALGNPPTERRVTSVRVQELVEAERARLAGPFPPLRSLTRYWRVDVVDGRGARGGRGRAPARRPRGRAGLRRAVVTDPALIRRGVPDRLLPGDDPLFPDQRYLQPAPDGVDAAAAWGFRGGRGEGVQFVDVEEAWRWTHEDLDALGVTLLRNTNRDGRNGFPGDHGNATLGVVAGVDHTVGVVGIAPRLDKRPGRLALQAEGLLRRRRPCRRRHGGALR